MSAVIELEGLGVRFGRRQILEDLDSGKITSEEAMKMLEESQS